MSPRSKTLSPAAAPLELIGRGTTSCVVRTGPETLTKIVTNPTDVESKEIRELLLRLDPDQRRLVGPLSVTTRVPTAAERDALRRCVRERPMRPEKIDPEAPIMAFVKLADAGKTVGSLKTDRARLTVAQVAAILVDAIAALQMLHLANETWLHGDVQPHNVAVKFAGENATGDARASLIDFGLTRRKYDPVTRVHSDIGGDIKGFMAVAATLMGLADREAEPVRYKCLSDALAAFKSGTKGLPIASQLSKCVAEPGAAAAAAAPAGPPGPVGSPRSPESPPARFGARRRMDFGEDSPAPASSSRARRARSGDDDDAGAGPSKRALAF